MTALRLTYSKYVSTKAVKPTLLRRCFASSDDNINFIKEKSFKSSVQASGGAHHKKDMEDQYSSDNHSLLPYVYMYRFFEDNIGYVLLEPRTRKLVLIDAGDFEASNKVVTEIEKQQKGAKLEYILTTHHHGDH